MSLLDDRREHLTLIPEIEGTDDLDNPQRKPDPDEDNWVTVYGRVQYASSTENNANGQSVRTVASFICREFPAGAWARVMFNGVAYDVDGEPIVSNGSDVTRHTTVSLKSRTAKPVGV